MNIGVLMSNHGGSPLTVGLERALSAMGHYVFAYETHRECDLILIFNQCAHTQSYVYPDFPPESCSTPIAFIDTAEYGWAKRVHEPLADYWNTFAPGAMGHDTKNREEQTRLRNFLAGRSFPYFIREFWNAWEFPAGYHPIDYPLYAPSAFGRLMPFDQYVSRPVQVACLWGLSNPWREHLTADLERSSLNKDLYVLERDGPRLPQHQYFKRMEAAKCSVSFDGYGSGSFRMTEVLCRTLLMQGPLAIQTRAPLVHGETCWAYMVWVDGEHYVRSDLVEQIQEAMADSERAYRIYRQGFHHCMTHLTEGATAQYVLRVIEEHDWSRMTLIERPV